MGEVSCRGHVMHNNRLEVPQTIKIQGKGVKIGTQQAGPQAIELVFLSEVMFEHSILLFDQNGLFGR